jgi:branched-chain amino acid transport system substrate-binding protein
MKRLNKSIWSKGSILFIGFLLCLPCYSFASPEKVVKIGGIFPLSGRAATWGLAAQKAIIVKEKEVNARGGLQVGTEKYRLEIIWEDDKATAAAARMGAEKLANRDKVKFILGPIISAPVLAIQPITEANQILLLTNSYAKEVLAPNKPYSFRMLLTSNEILQGMYPWMAKNYPALKKVAFIEPNDASGWSTEKDCKRIAEQNGFEVVFSQFYERGTTDFYPLLIKLISQKPDFIDYTVAPPGDQALIIKQARELGYKGKTFSGTTIDPPEFTQIAGMANAEGHISNTHDLLGAYTTEGQRRYHDDYIAIHGKPFDPVTPKYHVFLDVFVQAVEKAGSLDPTKVKEILEKTEEWTTIFGPTKFGGKEYYGIKRQMITPVYISELLGGKLVNRGTMMPYLP